LGLWKLSLDKNCR